MKIYNSYLIGNNNQLSGSLGNISQSAFTGSLFGTSSWSGYSSTSSYSLTASYALNGGGGGGGIFAQTGSIYATTNNLEITGSLNVTQGITGSLRDLGRSTIVDNIANTYNINWLSSSNYALTLTGSVSISFSDTRDGLTMLLAINQDITGSWEPIWSSSIKWSDGVVPIQTYLSMSTDIYTFTQINSNIYGSVLQNMK